jgi:hypothetical protein
LVPIWVPHWPVWMCKISRKATARRRGGAEKRKKLCVVVWLGKQGMPVARARVSRTGERIGFTTSAPRAVGAVQSALGVGAVATGEEQIGRCAAEQRKYYWLYLNSGKLALAAMYYLRRLRVAGRSFAAALMKLSTVVRRWRHKTSAWASSGPAGGRR